MILPSDSDPPPDRNEWKDSNDPPPWWESPDAESDEEATAEDDDVSYIGNYEDPDFLPPELATRAGPGWRKQLYKELMDSLIGLQAIEDPEDEFAPPEPPDLYTFYGELAALRNEFRRQGEQSNNNLSQLTKTLNPLGAQAPPWPVDTCLSILSVWDLISHANSTSAFKTAFQPLLKSAGLSRIPTENQPFDPATMTLLGAEQSIGKAPQLVLREITAGFLRAGSLLRPAGVIVSSA